MKKVVHLKGHKPLNCSAKKSAFSLVEMLMALLVASLLMAALAPVITKKVNDVVGISIEGNIPGKKIKNHKITYEDCINSGGVEREVLDSNGRVISKYCEGEFIVPTGFNGTMTVTAVGAGGGGGAAATAGYTEYTTEGSASAFIVPLMTNTIEATLISGGAGGGAGGQVQIEHTFVTNGNGNVAEDETHKLTVIPSGLLYNWSIPEVIRNKYALITACGGGGGGGGKGYGANGGGGGSGGYFVNHAALMNANTSEIHIGGYGGGGGGDDLPGNNGGLWDGGGGGSGIDGASLANNTSSGGAGGYCLNNNGGYGGKGGGCGGCTPGEDGKNGPEQTNLWIHIAGGNGSPAGGGKGGNAPIASGNFCGFIFSGGGGGGGSIYQGGGGGGAGGGSGGGGGGITGFMIHLGHGDLIASGGGGGGGSMGSVCSIDINAITVNQGGGGGGGGGIGGGDGGNGGGRPFDSLDGYPGKGGNGGNPGSGYNGGQIPTIFGNNYCNGGDGANDGIYASGNNGKSGAMRITYLSYGPGGGGGGGAAVVPIQKISTSPQEVFSIKVGSGVIGYHAGKIESNTGITKPLEGNIGMTGIYDHSATITSVSKNNNIIIATDTLEGGHRAVSGCPSGVIRTDGGYFCGNSGWLHNGQLYNGNFISYPSDDNFSIGYGHSANNGTRTYIEGATSFPNGSTGGDGGKVTTPWFSCTPGKGGTLSNPKGGDAIGYGCGGGGGYGLADGGKGSGGYARISWNKYWNTEKGNRGEYELNNAGAGGGGASGNIMKFNVTVKSGDKIKYRIGKGGEGAYIVATSNASIVEATSGGDTVFAYGTNTAVKAGGGHGGKSPFVSEDNSVVINGAGGSVSNICHFNNTSKIDTSDCKKGSIGGHPVENKGGDGSSRSGFSSGNNSSDNYGTGGKAKAAGRGDTNGEDAKGYGAGGAGASLRDMDYVTPSESVSNPTRGGNGSNGVIELRWEE